MNQLTTCNHFAQLLNSGLHHPLEVPRIKSNKRLTDYKRPPRIEYMFDIGSGSGGRTPDGLCGRTPTSA
jgi:hypothetical protein